MNGFCVTAHPEGEGRVRLLANGYSVAFAKETLLREYTYYPAEKEKEDFEFFTSEVQRIDPKATPTVRSNWFDGYRSPEAYSMKHRARIYYHGYKKKWDTMSFLPGHSYAAALYDSIEEALHAHHEVAIEFFVQRRDEARLEISAHEELQASLVKKKYVTHVEPHIDGGMRTVTVTTDEAVKQQRALVAKLRTGSDCYDGPAGARRALDDYMVVNWAYYSDANGKALSDEEKKP